MNPKGQGAIEYLLIIAAAILVVAIVIIAITGALSGGQDQESSASQGYILSMTDLKRNYLIEAGKLTLGELLEDAQLAHPITRANGDSITNQTELDEAYANGELILYKTGIEISAAQKKETAGYNGEISYCTRNFNQSHVMVEAINPITGAKKVTKFIPKSTTSEPIEIIGKTFSSANWSTSQIWIAQTDNLLTFNDLQSACIGAQSFELNDFKLEVYDYTLIANPIPPLKNGEIGINLTTGLISGIEPTTTDICENKHRYCVLNDYTINELEAAEYPICDSPPNYPSDLCYIDGRGNNCADFDCLSTNCDMNHYISENYLYKHCVNKITSDLTIDYFHENS